MGGDRLTLCCALGLLAAGPADALPPSQQDMTRLVVSNFIGRLEVSTRDVAQPVVKIDDFAAATALGLKVEEAGDEIRITMPPLKGNVSCISQNGRTFVQVGDRAPANLDEFPRAVVLVPSSIALDVSMVAGEANLGDLGSLTGVIGGCSRLNAGDVVGGAMLELASGARVSVANTSGLRAQGRGGAKLSVQNLSGETDLILTGGSSFSATSVHGNLTSRQEGSSRVEIESGVIEKLDLDLSRIARFKFGGVVDSLGVSANDIARVEIGAVKLAPIVRNRARGARVEIGGELVAG